MEEDRNQQELIDAEMRDTRRVVLTQFREQLRLTPQTLTTADFLRVADRPVVLTAITIAAGAVAGGCVLHTVRPATRILRIARHHGLPARFVEHFASVDESTASTCAVALRTGLPVLVDDVTTSSIFRGRGTLRVLLDAGSRSVHSYPLRTGHDALLGVLCLHHRVAGRHPGRYELAEAASHALSHVAARPSAPDRTEPDPVRPAITVSRTGDVVTIVVRGTLDALTVPDRAARIHETINGLAEGQVLIVDLNEMDFLAVAGARALTAAAELCVARGVHHYTLIDQDHIARRVLTTLRIAPRLRLITDATPVLASLLP
ncbi:GAF domain-containing protein [Actinoplanes couchii]|uniref:STAS domain-containing protein n=1 Tax=Actinoplanes couchii TaxID=403638 RepID=A0ABQ3XI18_9ACTN|nr:GAF domain-containing protein [Actinoplanes couchii]MDR6324591.1 anti-anti-sigma regulatory factor [Actinoplanes couchii]GID58143.1 hypothetical protein Aco03nite_065470 [Actinoplanes couchii]